VGAVAQTELFKNLSFSLSNGEVLGLIAANGRGKTTLLRFLSGQDEPSSGQIVYSRGAKIGYVEQEIADKDLELSVYDFVASALSDEQRDYESWRIDVALAEFGVPDEQFHAPLKQMSGGWRRLIMIARVWLTEPDILLLDEPTNHLDLQKIIRLENWIKQIAPQTPVILASHDRAFLDNCTNRSLFLRPAVSKFYSLPFSKAREVLEEEDVAEERVLVKEQKQAKQLREQAAKLNNVGINSGSDLLQTKAKQLRERASNIEQNMRELHKERPGDITLSNSGTHAKVLMSLEDVSVTKPNGEELFHIDKELIYTGDRIVILAQNGAGKTQFVNAVHKAFLNPDQVPGIWVTPSAVLGYADQEISQLPDDETPHGFITSQFDVGDDRARSLLANIGFEFEKQTKGIKSLSYGQKSRLAILALRLTEPNFYLLDEPTNHIDIEGREQLEHEIIEKGATAIIVSHDRQFARNVGTRFFEIDKSRKRGRLLEVDGPEPFFERQEEL
jgi:ATPase subunit of ABC transporter with duplicated ATPase domains